MVTIIKKESWEPIPLESIEQEIRHAYSNKYSISIQDEENEINISIDFHDWCKEGEASTYIETDSFCFTRQDRTLKQVLECIQ